MPKKKPIPRQTVKTSWMIAFLAFVALLIASVSFAFDRDRSSWTPTPTKRAAVLPWRGAIGKASLKPSRIDYRRIDARLERLIHDKAMIGLGVAIIENGELRFVKGYGTVAANDPEPVTVNTVFRWASLSKGVAATMIAKLAEDKRLSLDDHVSKFGTSLRLPKGGEGIITVANLLSHRTGLVKNAYDDKLEEGIDPKIIRMALGKLDLFCKPGTCHTYQNVAYDTSSEIVARLTRESYQQAVRDTLLVPLGMDSASLDRAGLINSPSWARPHVGRRVVPVEDAYYRIPAAGGMNSSIFDLGLWMRAQMGEAPQVISRKVLETIHEPRVKTEKRRSKLAGELVDGTYGLGWRNMMFHGHRIIGHRGAVRGYHTFIMFDPATKTGVGALWNSESNKPAGLELEVFDMLYGLPDKDWLELGEK